MSTAQEIKKIIPSLEMMVTTNWRGLRGVTHLLVVLAMTPLMAEPTEQIQQSSAGSAVTIASQRKTEASPQ